MTTTRKQARPTPTQQTIDSLTLNKKKVETAIMESGYETPLNVQFALTDLLRSIATLLDELKQ